MPHGAVTAVSWAPIFEGPLAVHSSLVEAYYDAYVAFSRLMKAREQSPNTGTPSSGSFIQLRMQPGDMVVFNNRRMLHGRRAFGKMEAGQAATERHLQGCYLNIDEYKSALSVLTAKQALNDSGGNPNSALSHMEPAAHDVVLKRVGNQCMT
jgi:gamma-butyrobetaine dioxygenase